MKKITLLLSVLTIILINNISFSQVTLSPADILVLQFNSDGTSDEIALLSLVDISSGDIIFISDASWNLLAAGGPNYGNTTSERGIKLTVGSSGIAAGTIIRFDNPTTSQLILENSSLGTLEYYKLNGTILTDGDRELNLSTSGDQLVIFQTSNGMVNGAPVFIYAFNNDDTNGASDGFIPSTETLPSSTLSSHLPSGLTALNSTESNRTLASAFGISAFLNSGTEVDNYQYIGPVNEGTRDEWLTRVHTSANWSSSDNIVFNNGTIANGSNVVVSSTLGIKHVTTINDRIKIFPNPSSEYISILGLNKTTNYKIYNTLGYEVESGKTNKNDRIDIKNFSNGLYFFKIENSVNIKFVKK